MTQAVITNGLTSDQRTEGVWEHTGKLIVSRRLDNGTPASVTLPDSI